MNHRAKLKLTDTITLLRRLREAVYLSPAERHGVLWVIEQDLKDVLLLSKGEPTIAPQDLDETLEQSLNEDVEDDIPF